LEIYVDGSLNIFNHRTNVDIKRECKRNPLKKFSRKSGLRKKFPRLIKYGKLFRKYFCLRTSLSSSTKLENNCLL